MMRQHEHRDAIRRLVTPPALPAVVRPSATHGAEHVAAEYPRADVRESPRRAVVVGTGFTALVALHVLPRPGVDKPVEQLGTADAQRMLQILVRSGAVAVDRYRERVDAKFRHDVPFGLIAIQCLVRRTVLANERPRAVVVEARPEIVVRVAAFVARCSVTDL